MIIREDKEGPQEKIVTLRIIDYEGQIEELLNYLSDISSAGHSFNIVVDPNDDDYKQEFWIDGDGSDKIYIDSIENMEDEEE